MTGLRTTRRTGAKISIIGAGKIGTNVAFQVFDKLGRTGLVEEIVLIGKNKEEVSCVAEEIHHTNDGTIATRLTPSTVPNRAAGSDIIVYAAGRTIKPGETRESLLVENGLLARTIREELTLKGNEIFITVTNPVDVLNTYFSRELGLPMSNVLGFGGMLDSARFRCVLVEYLRHAFNNSIMPQDVKDAFVLGQHGGNMTPIFEKLGLPANVPFMTPVSIEKIRGELAEIVPKLIRIRGCADFAPSAHIFRLIALLLQDADPVPECCSIVPPKQLQQHYGGEVLDVSFGIPLLLKRGGISAAMIEISKESQNQIGRGMKEIRDYVDLLYEKVGAEHKKTGGV
jgi:malate dehydrogenase